MSKAPKNHLTNNFQLPSSNGTGSWHFMPCLSDLSICIRSGTLSQKTQSQLGHVQPQSPTATSRASPLQAHLCVMESNSSSKELEILPRGHTPVPLGHRGYCISLLFDHQEKAQNSNNNTNNNTTALHSASIWHYHTVTSHSTDDDYIMQTRDTYHKHASGIPFSLCFHGKLNSGKTTALKLSGIQVSTVRTLTRHLQDCCLSPGTAHDITDSTSGVRKRLLTQLHTLVKSSAVKEKCKSPEGWISVPVIKAGWNGLK